MDGPCQFQALFGHIVQHFPENIVFRGFHIQVFVSRNRPLHPARRGFRAVRGLHARQIQAFRKPILPWPERMGKIGHGAPYPRQIAVPVLLGQVLHLLEMAVGILPESLDKAFPIICRAFLSYHGKGFLHASFDFHLIISSSFFCASKKLFYSK